MPRLEYFVIAESSSIDVTRNSVSIFHVLNEIRVDQLPDAIHSLTAISGWIHSDAELRNKHESQIRIEFNMPDLESPVAFRGNLDAESKYQYYNFNFEEIPILNVGDVVIELFLDGEQIATHTMTISLRE